MSVFRTSAAGLLRLATAGVLADRIAEQVRMNGHGVGPAEHRSWSRSLATLAQDLVDAISLFMAPVVLGGGKKLFADGSAPHSFKLSRSRVSPNGLIVTHYEREGEVRIADTALDSPSEREIARRERMKREG